MQQNLPILILGAGHMGGALARGWHKAGRNVELVVRSDAKRAAFEGEGMRCHASYEAAPREISALVLAIKPQQFPDMQAALKAHHPREALLISIMAGVPLASLTAIAPHTVRAMPNLPALIGESMSTLYAPSLDVAAQGWVTQLFETVGDVAWFADEAALHLPTALTGCGPGYVFAFMDAMEKAAIARGMDAALAGRLVRKTLRGAALLADDSDETPAMLARNVASPGGVTQAALDVFRGAGLDAMVAEAIDAAMQRSKKLAG